MIPIRRAGDTGEGLCGFVTLNTVARCGATLVGDFAHIGPTDDVTGWT